ncbi:hypothetical protein [Methylomicrobium lacus]|uniref:hypothetical protein n=1 Tax=Methylomicrobium lacus TaxID=136992 RepID=UPI0035A95B5A
MLPLLSIRNTILALGFLLLTGCAEFNSGSGWNAYTPTYYNYNDPYSQSDFDELLGFGATMANISPSSRAETCRLILKRQKDSRSSREGIQLHLMVGRLLSDACGDIPRILNGVGSISGRLNDDRTRKLVAIHTEALKRMSNQPRRLGTVERKHKTVPDELEPKESTGSKKDENRLLREKLEAIRSMEKQMDQSDGTN